MVAHKELIAVSILSTIILFFYISTVYVNFDGSTDARIFYMVNRTTNHVLDNADGRKCKGINLTTPRPKSVGPIGEILDGIKVVHLPDVRDVLIQYKIVCKQPIKPEVTYNIPMHLHFLWISKDKVNSSNIPNTYLWRVATFCKMNPKYKVSLWMDRFTFNESVNDYFRTIQCQNFKLELIKEEDIINRRVFDYENSVGARSDILRYEIIYNHGGIYMDTDSLAIVPFKNAHGIFKKSFVIGPTEPYNNICNCMFGFPKGSRFLKYLIGCLNDNYFRGRAKPVGTGFGFTGPGFMTMCFKQYNDSKVNMIHPNYLLHYRQPNIMYQTFDATWLREETPP